MTEETIAAWVRLHPWITLGLYALSAFLVALGTDVVYKSGGGPGWDDPNPIQVGLLWPAYLFLGFGMLFLGACASPIIGAIAGMYWVVDHLGSRIALWRMQRRALRYVARCKAEQRHPWEEAQRESFAYGNATLANPDVTREVVDHASEQLIQVEKGLQLRRWKAFHEWARSWR